MEPFFRKIILVLRGLALPFSALTLRKLCLGGPKFLPKPNLLLCLISSTSREAMLRLCDPGGPYWSLKMIKNTP